MIEKLFKRDSILRVAMKQASEQRDALWRQLLSDVHGNFELRLLNVSQQLHLILARERHRAHEHFE